MPADGFSDPPAIEVTPEGITAGYSLAIPSAGVGAFSLENISISAEMELPFVDKPVALRLGFSERFHPFLVTVSLVGGGGFLAIELSTHGIQGIEGSLELGGNITVSLAIVEANAHVMIGFHFGIRQADGGGILMDFTAYIRVGASVDLLGIVRISGRFLPRIGIHTEVRDETAARGNSRCSQRRGISNGRRSRSVYRQDIPTDIRTLIQYSVARTHSAHRNRVLAHPR